ncbi:MAG: iron-dicitrate ABC transporter permease FecC [Cardiobacteriaceae bacterium]|nr:iron-dicitrate ABC transporter permease FecC [Cardiobacteriaceae bacterium]
MLIRWLIPIMALIGLLWGNVFVSYPTAFTGWETLKALWGMGDELAQITIIEMRLPRSLTAMALGAQLALAGALLQTMTRNPLASPSLLSVNSGASLGMVIATVIFPRLFSGYSMAWITTLGGGLSWLWVMWLGGAFRPQSHRQKLILAGVTVSLFCGALTQMVIIIAEDHAANVLSWLAGGVAHVRWVEWKQIAPFLGGSALFVLCYSAKLNVLQLSDESAQTLGINLKRMRWLVNGVALLLVGSAVSVAGALSFIGLLMPHLARYWIGYDLRKALPMSMILGACLMLSADMLARTVAFPREIPTGAILALIGAPVFVWFARRRA